MRALVMSGGSVKGAYEVGAIKHWIVDEGRDYDIVCGVSVGAINAAFLAQYPMGQIKQAHADLVKMWGTVNNAKVRKDWWGGIAAALWKPSVYDSTPLQRWLRSDLSPAKIKASGRKLRVGAVSLTSGSYRLGTEQDANIVDWVIASSSFPVFLLPIEIDGELWSDGGIRNVTPLGAAIELGATEVDVVMCSNPDLPDPWSGAKRSIPDIAVRVVDLMNAEIMRDDLKVTSLKNLLAKVGSNFRVVKTRVLKPSGKLVDNSLDFDPAAIARMMELGYKDAVALGDG
jgi:NTE family protein